MGKFSAAIPTTMMQFRVRHGDKAHALLAIPPLLLRSSFRLDRKKIPHARASSAGVGKCVVCRASRLDPRYAYGMSRKPRSKKKRRSTSVLGRRASAEWPSHLADRLASASEGLSCREIADSTGNNHENVRRYMKTGAPSLEFLRAFCEHFGVSADWLLFGRTAKGSQGSSGGPAASKKLRAAMDLLREADSFLGTASKARR